MSRQDNIYIRFEFGEGIPDVAPPFKFIGHMDVGLEVRLERQFKNGQWILKNEVQAMELGRPVTEGRGETVTSAVLDWLKNRLEPQE